MKYLIKKNLKFRKFFDVAEKKTKIFRYLFMNNKIFLHVRWQCFLNTVKMIPTHNLSKLKKFFFITGKTSIILKGYRMSRFSLRKFISTGKLTFFFS
jgi:hypothetical protein